MPFYSPIRRLDTDTRTRTLAGLKRLRAQLDAEIPPRSVTKSLMLGTWNLRNFDDNRFYNGKRKLEDFIYIAEIASRFDVLAVQEICEDMRPLDKVLNVLGPDYDYVFSDITEGPSGNKERLGFIYDTNKVLFRGVTGELVLPDRLQIIDGEGEDAKRRQFARSPFMCAFQSGWFKFVFTTVHIYFGADSGPKYKRRVSEIRSVAKFLSKRADRDVNKKELGSHILVGDFNIKFEGSDGDEALTDEGFDVFRNRKGSNKDQTRFYDQISFKSKKDRVQLASEDSHGVVQFFDRIYREEDFETYRDDLNHTIKAKIAKLKRESKPIQRKIDEADNDEDRAKAQEKLDKKVKQIAGWQEHLDDDAVMKDFYLGEWRTFRASDHLPLWVELKIDFSGEYLDGL